MERISVWELSISPSIPRPGTNLPTVFYGIGLSYGYVLPLTCRWAAEFTIGAGYVHTKYDSYYNIPNGARYEKGIHHNYWGLTKVGIGLAYRFGK